MRVIFAASHKGREQRLARAFRDGVEKRGDECAIVAAETAEDALLGADTVAMVGVKSRALWRAVWRSGGVPIMLDKGYIRGGWRYWRASVGAHHPTRFLMRGSRRPPPPSKQLGEPSAWRRDGSHVVFLGSSAKYHSFHGLPHPTEYAETAIAEIRRTTGGRPVIYRPKPSWRDAVPVPGARMSTGSLSADLAGAWATVTHGSNACIDSALAGVPCVVLGDAVARPISSVRLRDVAAPHLASREIRCQWLENLAFWHWDMREISRGVAWKHLRAHLQEAASGNFQDDLRAGE